MKKHLSLIISLLLVICFALPAFAISALDSQEIVKFGKDVIVEEWESVKSVVVFGGALTINGRVEEDAVAIGGSISLAPGAEVGGDAVVIGGTVTKPTNAKITGDVVEIGGAWLGNSIKGAAAQTPLIAASFAILSAIAMLVLLVVLAALFPKQIEKALAVVEKEWLKSFGFGVLGLILIVPIIIGLIISLLGIPLIPIFFLIAVAGYIMGYVVVAGCIGRRIFKSFKPKKAKPLALEVLLGAVVILLVGIVPFVGWLAKSLAILAGFGAVILTRFGTQKG